MSTWWKNGLKASVAGGEERELERDATVRLVPGRGGITLRVRDGSVLVTQAGDPDDHVLGAGGALRLAGRGLAVAWALSPSRLAVTRGAAADARRERLPSPPSLATCSGEGVDV